MDLINNRFRIIKTEYSNRIVSLHEVISIMEGDIHRSLYVINPKMLPESFINKMLSEYENYQSIKHPFLVKITHFDMIFSVNRKSVNRTNYYFVVEQFDYKKTLLEYIEKDGDADFVLSKFIDILKIFSLIAKKNYFYESISSSTIYIDENLDIKIKDIVTDIIQSNISPKMNQDSMVYKAPEIFTGEKPSIYSTIYSLGVYLEKLLINKNFELKYKDILLPVIRKMKEYSKANRYYSLYYVIKDINKATKKKYSLLFSDKLYYTRLDSATIGRENIIEQIMKAANLLKQGENEKHIFEIKGEYGTGKTKLLMTLRKKLSINNINIFASFSENRIKTKNNPFIDLLAKILDEKGQPFIDKYPKVLNYIKNAYIKDNDFASYAQINLFIEDCFRDQPTALIIDDVKKEDKNTAEIIKYLSQSSDENSGMIIIYSCVTSLDIDNSTVMPVNSLNIEQTTKFIRDFLGMTSDPVDLATRIYKNTYGKVDDLNRTMKSLLEKDILYLDSKGEWNLDIKNYDQMFIADDNFVAVTDVFMCLSDIQKEILTCFSLFKNPSSSENIYGSLDSNVGFTEITMHLNELVDYNILNTHFNDDGYYYEFQDKTLKRNIYNSIDNGQRIKMHNNIANIIIKKYPIVEKSILEELIFHLKNANDYKKAAFYAIDLAREYLSEMSIDDGLEKYNQAMEYSELSKDNFTRIIVTQRSGAAYFAHGKNDKAIQAYLSSIKVAQHEKNHKIVINSMNKLVELYLERNRVKAAEDMLQRIREYLDIYFPCKGGCDEQQNYKKGLLDYHVSLCRYYVHINDIQNAFRYSQQGLDLIYTGYKKQKGLLKYYKSIASKSRYLNIPPEEIEKICNETLEIFKQISYAKGIAMAYNNLGILNSEYKGDNKKAIEYFSLLKDISTKYNMYSQKCIAYTNLAEVYFWELEYEEAYKCFRESLKIAIELNKQDLVFYNYVYIAELLIEMLDFKKAAEYIEKAQAELKINPNQATSMANYNRTLALMHLYNGDIYKAKEYIDKVFEFSEYFSLVDSCRVKIIYSDICIRLSSDKDEHERLRLDIFDQIKLISNYPIGLKELIDFIVIKGFLDDNNFDTELCKWGIKTFKPENSRMKQDLNFLKTQIYKDKRIFIVAEELRSELNSGFDKRMNLQSNFALFKIYSSINDYYSALGYIIDSYLILKEMIYINRGFLDPLSNVSIVMKEAYLKLQNFISLDSENPTISSENVSDFSYIEADIRIKENSILSDLIANDALKDIIYKKLGIEENISSDKVIESLRFSNIKNIELLLRHMKNITWANSACIVIESDDEIIPLLSLESIIDVSNLKRVINQVRMSQEKVYYSDLASSDVAPNKRLLLKHTKGFMCFAIYNNFGVSYDRRNSKKSAIAYVYLESENNINNFNEDSYGVIEKFSNLLGAFIDNYNLSYKYSIDKLTGAYNRQYLDLYLKNEIDDIYNTDRSFSVVLMDIDRFKKVNDTFGHTQGDSVLRQFTLLVQKAIRTDDVFCRYGGEEFILILKDAVSEESLAIANRIRLLIEKNLLDPAGKSITVSMGISSYPQDAQWEEELITKADIALYNAKNSGRNAVRIWSKEIDERKLPKKNDDDLLIGIFGDNLHRSNLFVKSINMLKENIDSQEKLENYLRYVLDYFRAENLYIVSCCKNRIENVLKVDKNEMISIKKGFKKIINTKFIKQAYEKGDTLFTTDWENTSVVDEITGIPQWQSILATPVIHAGEAVGVLYITSPVISYEFGFKDSAVAKIIAPIIGSIL